MKIETQPIVTNGNEIGKRINKYQGEVNMAKNKYGEVNVKRKVVEDANVDVLAEIEIVDYMDDTVTMWLTKEDVAKLIDELSELLREQ